jgi:hypothetical protein
MEDARIFPTFFRPGDDRCIYASVMQSRNRTSESTPQKLQPSSTMIVALVALGLLATAANAQSGAYGQCGGIGWSAQRMRYRFSILDELTTLF